MLGAVPCLFRGHLGSKEAEKASGPVQAWQLEGSQVVAPQGSAGDQGRDPASEGPRKAMPSAPAPAV